MASIEGEGGLMRATVKKLFPRAGRVRGLPVMASISALAPLVPAEVNLRGYEFMPYYGDRLRDSDLNSRATDSEYRAAHNLWWSAWKQVPAASLPNDDLALCKLADLGRDLKTWSKVKAKALHGFVLCSDGRLYHKALAPLAIEAWEYRNKQRNRTEAARKARQSQRPGGDVTGEGPAQSASVTKSTGEDRIGQENKDTAGPAAPDLFTEACKLYPKRAGNDPDKLARKSWDKRIAEGVFGETMIEGVNRYAHYCTATGKIGTDYVMQRATFFGDDRPFAQGFEIKAAAGPDMAEWWKSDEGIKTKGIELNYPYPPKAKQVAGWYFGYKLKVFELAGRGPWISLVPERLRPELESAWAEAST